MTDQRIIVPAVIALFAAAGAARAQEYPDPVGIATELRSLAADPRADSKFEEIGRSVEGRPVLLASLAVEGPAPAAERPRILVVAGLEADQRAGTAVAARLLPELRALAEKDEAAKTALAKVTVDVVPCANPDGLAALLAGPTREHRLNLRPADQDRDGLTDEDGPDDLDADGRIAWMRVPDPEGEWRASDEDPRLLVKADAAKGERGIWKLLPEGLDNDGDGEVNEDPPGGVDLDRNFAHGWKEHDPEAGTSCPSEPETRALIEHALRRRTLAAVVVLGRRDNVVKVPGKNEAGDGVAPNGAHPDDLGWWNAVSTTWKDLLSGKQGEDDPADGAFHQWAYFQRGVPAFALKVFHRQDPAEIPPLPSGKKPETEEAKWLSWSDRELAGAGFVPWKAFAHPTLGDVEIGGFAPLAKTNPPAALLADLTARHAKAVADLAGRLPRLAWTGAKAIPLGGGVFEIKATLVNEGTFPALTAMARRTRALLPVRVTIGAAPEAVLHGERLVRVEDLRGGGGARAFRWVVRGEAGSKVALRAVSENAGTVETEVTL